MNGYENETQIQTDALAAGTGDKEAFMRVANGMINDPDWELRCLCAFALLDELNNLDPFQLLAMERAAIETLKLATTEGVYRRTLILVVRACNAGLSSLRAFGAI